MLLVGKDLVLEWQEDTRRVDQVDDREPVLQGDLLGPQHLLRGQREPGAGLDRRVVRDHHDVPAMNLTHSRHHPRARCAPVLLVGIVGDPEAELQEGRVRIAQRGDSLARRHLAQRPLFLLTSQAASLAER